MILVSFRMSSCYLDLGFVEGSHSHDQRTTGQYIHIRAEALVRDRVACVPKLILRDYPRLPLLRGLLRVKQEVKSSLLQSARRADSWLRLGP